MTQTGANKGPAPVARRHATGSQHVTPCATSSATDLRDTVVPPVRPCQLRITRPSSRAFPKHVLTPVKKSSPPSAVGRRSRVGRARGRVCRSQNLSIRCLCQRPRADDSNKPSRNAARPGVYCVTSNWAVTFLIAGGRGLGRYNDSPPRASPRQSIASTVGTVCRIKDWRLRIHLAKAAGIGIGKPRAYSRAACSPPREGRWGLKAATGVSGCSVLCKGLGLRLGRRRSDPVAYQRGSATTSRSIHAGHDPQDWLT